MAGLTYWSKDFWLATLERVVRTAAGAMLALIIVDGFDLLTADWVGILSAITVASLISLLMAISSNGVTKSGPALTDSEQVIPPLPQPVDDDDYIPERALNDEDRPPV
jgi:hypothetical protein